MVKWFRITQGALHVTDFTEMTQTKKKESKKTQSKQQKKAPVSKSLPNADQDADAKSLPRGQELLADGTIRLKTGDHNLGDTKKAYDVHGARIELSGKVLIASMNVNWLSMVKCQRCNTPRTDPVKVMRVPPTKKDGSVKVAITYWCHNEGDCQLGGRLYVAIYDIEKIDIS